MVFQKSIRKGVLLFWVFSVLFLFSCKKDEVKEDDDPAVDDTPIVDDDPGSNEFALEVEWIKTYGGSNEDDAASVAETPDGGYIVLGHTQSTDGDITDKNTTDSDLWVLKLTKDGAVSWSRTYGGSADDRGTKIITANDGGYTMVGYTRSNDGDVSHNAGFYDYWIVKLDVSGNIQWEKTYGFSGNDQAQALIQTSDGGYLITGFLDVTASGGQGNEDGKSGLRHGVGEFWAIKTNASGEFQWRRYFGGTDNDRAYDVIEADNGDFIMVGNSESLDFDITNPRGSYDYWAVRIDNSGNLVWAKNYGGSSIEIAYAITKTEDGNYLIAGDTRSSDQDVTNPKGNADAWIIKINDNGDLLWQKTYGGSQFDTGRGVVQLPDENIFVAGTSRSSDHDVGGNNGQSDFWLFVTDKNGTLLWEKNIGGSKPEFANAGIKTSDGKLIVAGSSESSDFGVPGNRGSKDVMIVKLK